MQALRNTKMIAAYAYFDNRVRILGYFIKLFAKVIGGSLYLFGLFDCFACR